MRHKSQESTPQMESIETLLRYRSKGIPLTLKQKDYLMRHGHFASGEMYKQAQIA